MSIESFHIELNAQVRLNVVVAGDGRPWLQIEHGEPHNLRWITTNLTAEQARAIAQSFDTLATALGA